MIEKIQEIIRCLKEWMPDEDSRQVTVGFDGFVDSIVRVIKNVDDKKGITYFEDISEFGYYLADKSGKSCSLELEEQVVKIGGNMPIMANALGSLGVRVNCIGAVGYPEKLEVFKGMSANCAMYSVAMPGYCTALEFNDGKIMMASNHGVNSMTWSGIKNIVGKDKLVSLFSESRIIGMFNWSEISGTTSIWEGIISDILPELKPDKQKILFFDLSDCSKRGSSDILHALELIGAFNRFFSVMLSLNENEAGCVFHAMVPGKEASDPEEMGDSIYAGLDVDTLIIHPVKYSIAWDHSGRYRVDNLYIEVPKLSTGGGDNFNAGLCTARLLGLGMESSLILANAASGFYVKNGYSADRDELMGFLSSWWKLL